MSGTTAAARGSKAKILVALLTMSGVMATNGAIMPILNEISISFPEASTNAIQMAYSVSLLVSLPVFPRGARCASSQRGAAPGRR